MLTVYVGTTNKKKINAVLKAFDRLNVAVNLIPYLPSNTITPPQPFEGETEAGATERSNPKLNGSFSSEEAFHSVSDKNIIHIGIESGIKYDEQRESYFDVAAISLSSGIYDVSTWNKANNSSQQYHVVGLSEKVYILIQYNELVELSKENPTTTFGTHISTVVAGLEHDNWQGSQIFGGQDRYKIITAAIVNLIQENSRYLPL